MNKNIKPEEVQNIPAFNYYASKEELSNSINNAIRENNKDLRAEFKQDIQEIKNDFRWVIGIGITLFISILGLYFKH